MDDLLDIYFKKARESLSEPAQISEIRDKINALPDKPASKFRISRKLQVLLVLVLVLIGAFVLLQYGNSGEEKGEETRLDSAAPKTEGAARDNIDPSNQGNALNQLEEEMPSEASTPEVAGKSLEPFAGQQVENKPEEELPEQNEDATSDPQPDIAPNTDPTFVPPTDAPPLVDPEEDAGSTDPGNSAGTTAEADRQGDVPPNEEPPKEEPVADAPPPVDPNKVSDYRFELKSTATKRDISALNKKLRAYGVKLVINTLEYDREWISKLKGELIVVKTGRKAKIVVNTSNFEKLVMIFEHSKNAGADQPEIYAEQ